MTKMFGQLIDSLNLVINFVSLNINKLLGILSR